MDHLDRALAELRRELIDAGVRDGLERWRQQERRRQEELSTPAVHPQSLDLSDRSTAGSAAASPAGAPAAVPGSVPASVPGAALPVERAPHGLWARARVPVLALLVSVLAALLLFSPLA